MNIEKLLLNVESTGSKNLSFHFNTDGTTPALKPERRKLYVVKKGKEFIYVGEANCCMKTRISRSLSSVRSFMKHGKARNGYRGYKWLHSCIGKKLSEFEVYVYLFDKSYDADENRHYIESVEGELVWLIRKETGAWPTFQNEIHFSNHNQAPLLAQNIFEKCN